MEAEARRLQCQPVLLAAQEREQDSLRVAERALETNIQLAAEGY